MKKSKWKPPYNKEGKTNFPIRKKSGVYLIKKKDLGSIVYVGFSGTDLYKTMYRHFQQWTHPQQPVVTYVNQDRKNFLVRVIYCTPKQAATLEELLIIKYKPYDNPQKLELIASKSTYQEEVLEKFYEAEEVPF